MKYVSTYRKGTLRVSWSVRINSFSKLCVGIWYTNTKNKNEVSVNALAYACKYANPPVGIHEEGKQDKRFYKNILSLITVRKDKRNWEDKHSDIGFNYRLPNLNAALLIAQFEKIDEFLFNKRILAKKYKVFFSNTYYKFFEEPENFNLKISEWNQYSPKEIANLIKDV